MNKQRISKNDYKFLSQELKKHQDNETITTEQMDKMLETYEVKEKLNFIQVLLVVGSILIGLSALSFIASNWVEMSKLTKFLLIIFFYLGVYVASFSIKEKYPKTSQSLIYLGVLIYGSGIFLVGQIFHFGGSFTDAFLLWAVGILPLIFLLKDKLIFAFLHILLFVYLNGQYVYDELPLILLLLIPLLYLGQRYIKDAKIAFLTNLLTLNFVWYLLDVTFDLEVELVTIIFFIIGLLLYFIRIPYYSSILKFQGNLIFSIAGFFLTFKWLWNDLKIVEVFDIPVHIVFSVLFFILLLLLVRKENLISLFFVGLVILRYYFDAMYDFLPKSIFFLVGGVILLGFGYYFEHKRRWIKGEEESEN